MEKTGLFKLMSKREINNLLDYVVGIEVGLDTNTRKNRSGKLMENTVEKYIAELNLEFYPQIDKKTIFKKFKLDLNHLSKNKKEQKLKKFDFLIKNKNQFFLIETNFYNSGGSKISETSRSFIALSREIEEYDNVKFIWITDGLGWLKTQNIFKEAYLNVENFLILDDLKNGKLKKIVNNTA